jgi:hypothetical protein
MTEDIMFWMDILGKLMSKHKSCKYHADFTVKSSIRLDTGKVHEFTLVATAINTGFTYDIFVNLENDTKLLCFERADGTRCGFKVHIVPSRLTRTVDEANLLIDSNKANQELSRKVEELQERNKQLESKLAAIKKLF